MKLNPNKTEEAPANFPDDPLIETDSEPESDRDFIDIFEYSDEQHDNTAPAKRRVNIVLRDAHDVEGKGMTVKMLWQEKFKNVFDHFKARSCKTCRAPDEMRFKTSRT